MRDVPHSGTRSKPNFRWRKGTCEAHQRPKEIPLRALSSRRSSQKLFTLRKALPKRPPPRQGFVNCFFWNMLCLCPSPSVVIHSNDPGRWNLAVGPWALGLWLLDHCNGSWPKSHGASPIHGTVQWYIACGPLLWANEVSKKCSGCNLPNKDVIKNYLSVKLGYAIGNDNTGRQSGLYAMLKKCCAQETPEDPDEGLAEGAPENPDDGEGWWQELDEHGHSWWTNGSEWQMAQED